MTTNHSQGHSNRSLNENSRVLRTEPAPPGNGRDISTASLAERFENEKRQIINSCFKKTDENGVADESYITHTRIVEDAVYRSTPPPPTSPEENKKRRVVIIAVRKTGLVRMHKAKENTNGTFSIGQTWLLNELSKIESFTGKTPTSYEEQQQKTWARDVGFIIHLKKEYFWRVETLKEKNFFIKSLANIHKKYTGGKGPALELVGFTADEKGYIYPSSESQRKPSARPSPSPAFGARPSLDHSLPSQHTPHHDSGHDVRLPSYRSNIRPSESQENGPILPGSYPQSEFVRNLRPQDSKSRIEAVRAESPSTNKSRNGSPGPYLLIDERSDGSLGGPPSTDSFKSRRGSRDGSPFEWTTNVEQLRANGTYTPNDRAETPPQPAPRSPERSLPSNLRVGKPQNSQFKQDQIPERRRPPINISNSTQELTSPEPLQEFVTHAERQPPETLEDQASRGVLNTPNGTKGSEAAGSYFDLPYLSKPDTTGRDADTVDGGTSKMTESVPSTKLQGSDTQSAVGPRSFPATPNSLPESPSQEESHRPGLGPMIKKKSTKEIASAFRKAALAHNAFKPRAGSASQKIRDEPVKSPNTPDGINGVFPAPSMLRDQFQDAANNPAPITMPTNLPTPLDHTTKVPDVTVTSTPASEAPASETTSLAIPQPSPSSLEKGAATATDVQEERRRKRHSNHSTKYAKALGIDHNLLEGRTLDSELAFSIFGRGDGESSKKSYDELHTDIRRELARVETGSWLGNFEQNDERITTVGRMLDKAIVECEELEGLLTLYNVELGTLSEDVAYIEAQSQGLQVQTANQRLLHTELNNLLKTLTISSAQLQVLNDGSLARPRDVQDVELALSSLYKALLTIDPKLGLYGARSGSADSALGANNESLEKIGNEISTMRAVRERKDGYLNESIGFIQRFKQHMAFKFREAESETKESLGRDRNGPISNTAAKLDLRRRDKARASLWMYSPLLLFTREISPREWEDLLRLYEGTTKQPYQEEFRDTISSWRRMARKLAGDEQDVLFTTQEKETDGIVARKLTVKRTKTIREGSRNSSNEKAQDGKIYGFEVFAGALYDMSQSVSLEQNFMVDLFHLTSLETLEFPDLVAAVAPELRKVGNLGERKPVDPDRDMAKRVQNTLEEMYSFWSEDLQSLVDWVVQQDPLQGVGVLFALESKLSELEETNQDFLTSTLTKIHGRLINEFTHFIDEQLRGIEVTKVKIKKRRGVIAFMKTFPYFSASIESKLPKPRADTHEIRQTVNDVYHRINKSMFESLKVIANDSPAATIGHKIQGPVGGDTEDKEILNYHILLIENMNHYIEEVDVRGNPVLQQWSDRASKEMGEHLDLYLVTVIRRPLGKLLVFLESTEALLVNAIDSPTSIATRASHSRATFKKVMSTFDGKEIRRGIETLKKRVEKHFGDADDVGLSRNLVVKVLKECEERYLQIHERTMRIVTEVYEGGLEMEWKQEDVTFSFRR